MASSFYTDIDLSEWALQFGVPNFCGPYLMSILTFEGRLKSSKLHTSLGHATTSHVVLSTQSFSHQGGYEYYRPTSRVRLYIGECSDYGFWEPCTKAIAQGSESKISKPIIFKGENILQHTNALSQIQSNYVHVATNFFTVKWQPILNKQIAEKHPLEPLLKKIFKNVQISI